MSDVTVTVHCPHCGHGMSSVALVRNALRRGATKARREARALVEAIPPQVGAEAMRAAVLEVLR